MSLANLNRHPAIGKAPSANRIGNSIFHLFPHMNDSIESPAFYLINPLSKKGVNTLIRKPNKNLLFLFP